jgi:branched-chain amino acid transport system substrate-binding protein
MKNNNLINLLILLALLLSVLSCSKKKTPDNEIRIGVILPITGSNKSVNHEIKNGIDFAIDLINNNYDLPVFFGKNIGLPAHNNARIKIIYRDFGDRREEVIQIVDDLVKNENVSLLIGCYLSSATAFASERAELHEIPFFNFTSTSPTLNKRGLRYFFRTTADDELYSANFFDFLNKQYEIKPFPKRIVLVYENSIWGTNVAQSEIKYANENGYKIVQEISYDYLKFSPDLYLDQIKKAMPAIIMHASYELDAVKWVNFYIKNDINPIGILAMNAGFSSQYFIKTLGNKADYIISRENWVPDLANNNQLRSLINKLFLSKYSEPFNGNSARAFTGMICVADILNRSNSFSPDDILKSTHKTNIESQNLIMPWKGIHFNKEGQNVLSNGIIVQMQNQEYYTVWPDSLAFKKVVWPKPKWKTD